MTGPASEIPQSDALREADPNSLAELLNRDPEHYSKQDRARVIAAYREMRAKMEKAAAETPVKEKAPRGSKAKEPSVTVISASAEDLDL